MGHMNYYRRFINGYAEMSRLVYGLVHNPEWTKECELALYLVNKPCTTGRITRWLLLLQEFDFEIVVSKGNQHFMVDHMLRVRNGEPSIEVDDESPEVVLFKVDYASEDYGGIVKYLMSGRPPPGMTKLEARQLIRRVGPYQLIAGQLYIKGKDQVIRICALP